MRVERTSARSVQHNVYPCMQPSACMLTASTMCMCMGCQELIKLACMYDKNTCGENPNGNYPVPRAHCRQQRNLEKHATYIASTSLVNSAQILTMSHTQGQGRMCVSVLVCVCVLVVFTYVYIVHPFYHSRVL